MPRARARGIAARTRRLLSKAVVGSIAQILELRCKHLLDSGRLVELFPEWSDERFPFTPYIPLGFTAQRKCVCSSSFAWKSWPESHAELAARCGDQKRSVSRWV